MQGIYKFTCRINNKVYIGQSINIESRYRGHYNNHRNSNLQDYNTKFYRALRKYGFENFDFAVIELIEDKNTVNDREIYWICYYDSFKNGYNSNSGGLKVTDCNELHPNAKMSNEEVLALKDSLLNSRISQYDLSKKYGVTQSEISNINTGKKWGNLGNYNYPIRKEEARLKGERSPKTVLNDEIVNTIRQRYVNETAKQIYKDYKDTCSYITFERALMGRTYNYLPIYKKKEKIWSKKPVSTIP